MQFHKLKQDVRNLLFVSMYVIQKFEFFFFFLIHFILSLLFSILRIVVQPPMVS